MPNIIFPMTRRDRNQKGRPQFLGLLREQRCSWDLPGDTHLGCAKKNWAASQTKGSGQYPWIILIPPPLALFLVFLLTWAVFMPPLTPPWFKTSF